MSPRKPLAALAAFSLALFGAEVGFGSIASTVGVDMREVEGLRTFLHDGHRLFEPFPYSGFVAHTTPEQEKDPTRPRDWAFEKEKRADLRIACLGGSTTHGKYPSFLQKELDRTAAESVEVMNWGVPGWTTLETVVNYVATVQDYAPDIVVLHHALNDVAPRRANGFRTDYAHWRKTWEDPSFTGLERWLIGTSDVYAGFVTKTSPPFDLAHFANRMAGGIQPNAPPEKMPPGTAVAFRRNVETLCDLVALRGGRVCLVTMPYKESVSHRRDGKLRLWAAGLEEHNEILREIGRERGLLVVDCEAGAKADPRAAESMFRDRVHLTWAGARVKAQAIARALVAAGWVE